MNRYSPVTSEDLSHLAQVVGERNFSTRQSDLDLHAQDQSAHEAHPPEVILWVENTEQVSRVLTYANEKHIPVTAWVMGTSLEGNPIALLGGILISFVNMNKIIAIHTDDFQATVQRGLGYKDLNMRLSRQGLFLRRIQVQMHPLVECWQITQRGLAQSDMAQPKIMFCACRWCWPMAVLLRPARAQSNNPLVMIWLNSSSAVKGHLVDAQGRVWTRLARSTGLFPGLAVYALLQITLRNESITKTYRFVG